MSVNRYAEDSAETPLVSTEPRRSKKRAVVIALVAVAVLCVVAAAVAAVVCLVVLKHHKPEKKNTDCFGVIIDAGSSGSRIYVYRWPFRENASEVPHVNPVTAFGAAADLLLDANVPPDAVQEGASSVKPGIAHVAPENVATYLAPLLEYAAARVPGDKQPATPIFLFATAGMRVLPEKEQDAILVEVRKTLGGTHFNFTYQEEWARVITGRDEGAYGWVTANYLTGVLFRDDAPAIAAGALDLGGASMQITFLPGQHPKNDSYSLVLPNNVFDLYTHSFLRYGQDMATASLIEYAAEAAKDAQGTIPDNVPFPCYLNGYTERVNITADSKEHTLVGTGSFDACTQYVEAILHYDQPCPMEPCSIDGVYQPDIAGDFYAMSGYYYTASFFGFANETKKIAPSLYKQHGSAYCALSWDEAHKQHPGVEDSYLKIYCMTSSYITSILTRGFKFPQDEPRIYVTDKINSSSLSWSLGGLIAEASLLPK